MRTARPNRRGVLRLALGTALAGLVAACASAPPPAGTPTFYQRLDEGGVLDEAVAVSLVNGHRARTGLAPLVLDPALSEEARRRAGSVAATDTSTWGETPRLEAARAGAAGSRTERVSAGYRTLAEAFSGWRDSPQHNAAMLAPWGRRLGIAAVDRPGTKYRVYWAFVVAD